MSEAAGKDIMILHDDVKEITRCAKRMNESSKLERYRYGTAAPFEDRKEKDTGMKTHTPRIDDLVIFLAGHPCFGGYLFSSSASVDDAKSKQNQ